jgi:hypothetical protein
MFGGSSGCHQSRSVTVQARAGPRGGGWPAAGRWAERAGSPPQKRPVLRPLSFHGPSATRRDRDPPCPRAASQPPSPSHSALLRAWKLWHGRTLERGGAAPARVRRGSPAWRSRVPLPPPGPQSPAAAPVPQVDPALALPPPAAGQGAEGPSSSRLGEHAVGAPRVGGAARQRGGLRVDIQRESWGARRAPHRAANHARPRLGVRVGVGGATQQQTWPAEISSHPLCCWCVYSQMRWLPPPATCCTVHKDGTVNPISSWDQLSEAGRAVAWRRITARNRVRDWGGACFTEAGDVCWVLVLGPG